MTATLKDVIGVTALIIFIIIPAFLIALTMCAIPIAIVALTFVKFGFWWGVAATFGLIWLTAVAWFMEQMERGSR